MSMTSIITNIITINITIMTITIITLTYAPQSRTCFACVFTCAPDVPHSISIMIAIITIIIIRGRWLKRSSKSFPGTARSGAP